MYLYIYVNPQNAPKHAWIKSWERCGMDEHLFFQCPQFVVEQGIQGQENDQSCYNKSYRTFIGGYVVLSCNSWQSWRIEKVVRKIATPLTTINNKICQYI